MRRSLITKIKRGFSAGLRQFANIIEDKILLRIVMVQCYCENALIKKSVTHLSNLLEPYNVWRKMNLPMTDTMGARKIVSFY